MYFSKHCAFHGFLFLTNVVFLCRFVLSLRSHCSAFHTSILSDTTSDSSNTANEQFAHKKFFDICSPQFVNLGVVLVSKR